MLETDVTQWTPHDQCLSATCSAVSTCNCLARPTVDTSFKHVVYAIQRCQGKAEGHACVVRQQEDEVIISLSLHFHLDRRAEIPEQGRYRLTGNIREHKLLLLLVYPQHCALLPCRLLTTLHPSFSPSLSLCHGCVCRQCACTTSC